MQPVSNMPAGAFAALRRLAGYFTDTRRYSAETLPLRATGGCATHKRRVIAATGSTFASAMNAWRTLRSMTEGPLNHFDRGKRFYPLVVGYLVSIHGLNELASRGVAQVVQEADEPEQLAADYPDLPIAGYQAGQVTPLLKPLALKTRIVAAGPIQVEATFLAREIASEATYLVPRMTDSAGYLLVLAHELTRDVANGDPLWEFLRHCRNAAAHGGRFRFVGREPRGRAAWRGVEIERALEGSRLMDGSGSQGTEMEPGLLALGDPIGLLFDIEREYGDLLAA